MEPSFPSAFDEALAREGPAAVFLPDRDGHFRFEPDWTRDAWERAPGPHVRGWSWLLLRDQGTGFVSLLLVTAPTLMEAHPRADVRRFPSLTLALEARCAFGAPPVTRVPWV
jgi:hypothetical protein